jgi:hypothetical protein
MAITLPVIKRPPIYWLITSIPASGGRLIKVTWYLTAAVLLEILVWCPLATSGSGPLAGARRVDFWGKWAWKPIRWLS